MFRTTRLLLAATHALWQQQRLITRLQKEKVEVELAYMRIGRYLIEQFLIALDTPEHNDQIRERLTTSLGFYRDEIAVREEHA